MMEMAILTRIMEVIGKKIRVLPFLYFISPGKFPNQFKAPGANLSNNPMITRITPTITNSLYIL